MIYYKNGTDQRPTLYRSYMCATCDNSSHEWQDMYCLTQPLLSIGLHFNAMDLVTLFSKSGSLAQLYHSYLLSAPGISVSRSHFALPGTRAFDNSGEIFESMVTNSRAFGLPESLSVLINFGYSDKHVMYSAENWNHECDLDEVWDPFSNICRELYCLADFDLENFECVGDNSRNSTEETHIMLPSSDVRIELVAIVFPSEATNETLDPVEITGLMKSQFDTGFRDFLFIPIKPTNRTSDLNITFVSERNFSNHEANLAFYTEVLYDAAQNECFNDVFFDNDHIRVSIMAMDKFNHGLEFNVSLVLHELVETNTSSGDYTDKTVALMAEMISGSNFQFPLSPDYFVRVTSMHEETIYSEETLDLWCRFFIRSLCFPDTFLQSLFVPGTETSRTTPTTRSTSQPSTPRYPRGE